MSALSNMAITGDKLTTAGMNGLMINLKHTIKLYLTQSVGKQFISTGIFSVSLITFGVWYLLETTIEYPESYFENDKTHLQLYGIIFGSYFFIGKVILGLFDEAVMAILHCVAIDMELNNGIPVHGSPTF